MGSQDDFRLIIPPKNEKSLSVCSHWATRNSLTMPQKIAIQTEIAFEEELMTQSIIN